jgi:hypothetical protein
VDAAAASLGDRVKIAHGEMDIKHENVRVCPGEYTTVWLQQGTESVQLEIRVTPGGTMEIFCDHMNAIRMKPFAEWWPGE